MRLYIGFLQEAMQRKNFAAKAAARALEEANANECIIRCLRLSKQSWKLLLNQSFLYSLFDFFW